jgi:hypothetical protein
MDPVASRFAALLGLLVPALLASACGTDTQGRCLALPCPLPIALTIDVTSSTGGPAAGATILVSGGTNGTVPCEAGTTASTCRVAGQAGTYQLEITAPGFEPAQRSVVVAGTTPECGCPTVVQQHLEVALTPAP